MSKSSISDWIQTIAVSIGIMFAIWEYALQDRTLENQKKKAVFELILAGQSDSLMKSAKIYVELIGKGTKVSEKDTQNKWADLLPLQIYYDSWAFCYKSDLCNKKLTQDYICEDILVFQDFYSKSSDSSEGDKDQTELIRACKVRVKK